MTPNDHPTQTRIAAIAATILVAGFALMLILFGVAAIIWALR